MAVLKGKKKFDKVTCGKCGGRGFLPVYSHVQDGVCFRCKGTGEQFIPRWTAPQIDERTGILMFEDGSGLAIGSVFVDVFDDRVIALQDDDGRRTRVRMRKLTLQQIKDAMDAAKQENDVRACLTAAAKVAAFKDVNDSVKPRALDYMEGSALGEYFAEAVDFFESIRDPMMEDDRVRMGEGLEEDWD